MALKVYDKMYTVSVTVETETAITEKQRKSLSELDGLVEMLRISSNIIDLTFSSPRRSGITPTAIMRKVKVVLCKNTTSNR